MAKLVLVVDDHPPTLKLIRKALEEQGIEAMTASNGAEGLLAVEQQRPDLIILDVIMPVMDGFQTLRVLRERNDTSSIPVVILSIRGTDQDVLDGMTFGADMYITKPFQMEELMTAVRRILDVGDHE